MSKETGIKVSVYKYPDRTNLVLGYDDPTTGKRVTNSAKTANEGEAIKTAAVWEDELNTGRYQAASKVTWQQFLDRYTEEKLSTLTRGTQATANVSLGHFKRVVSPDRLVKVTATVLSKFSAEMRKPRNVKRKKETVIVPGASEATIARHLRHIKAALRWAEGQGMIAKAPKVNMPKRAKGQSLARSRPVTVEEYERLLLAVPKVRKADAEDWRRFINGVWSSGLRVSEAVALSWDQDALLCVVTGKRPCIRIFGEGQKSGRDEILPLVPDFAELLLQTPEAERHGSVFRLLDQQTGRRLDAHHVGKVVSKIGRKAGIVTNKAEGKFAGCHDLRRAFGTRWAKRVMPAVLKRLMRHSSVETTMSYYVDLDAAEIADELWSKFGATEGNTPVQGNRKGNSRSNAASALVEENDVNSNQVDVSANMPL